MAKRQNRESASPPRRARSGASRGATRTLPLWQKVLGALVLPAVFGALGWQLHERLVVLPGRVATPSPLAKVLSAGAFSVAESGSQFWGTYGANLYFGMRTRSPRTPVVGLMWYQQPQQTDIIMPRVRHWCMQQDETRGYGWVAHDGRTFGVQRIADEAVVVQTAFVKRPGGAHGGDWTARISASPADAAANSTLMHSFIVYMALSADDGDGASLRPHLVGSEPEQYIDYMSGYTAELGHFRLKLDADANVIARSFLAARLEPRPELRKLKELVISATGILKLPKSKSLNHRLGLMGYVPSGAPKTDRPNVLALQVTFVRSTTLEVVFESGSHTNRPNELSAGVFDAALAERRAAFDNAFESTFALADKGYSDVFLQMGKFALSNMIGSVSYFHGYSKVLSEYNSQPVLYGPTQLFTTIPSRPFFPRGFLWDEGFHHLLLGRFDRRLSLEVLGSWLDLMNVEGWIPRELILGAEAEHRVPAEFIVQHNSVANPPMFFYLIGLYMDREGFVDEHADYLARVYPRLKVWYKWLNTSQSGPLPGTYRWRGRNATTDLELNPKTLPSGLDDYPRASHPTDDEYHLDLYCWMAVSSSVMARLAERVGDAADVRVFGETAAFLNDPRRLDELHWHEKSARYCDCGLHTRHLKLVKPPPRVGADGQLRPPLRADMVRSVLREPKRRLVSDTFGYVSLFPLFLRLVPADSAKLGRLLEQLQEADLLWSPFGLRSLAKTSPLYGARNTEHDPPYWRGSVWLNMNYLALAALRHYAQAAGPHRQQAYDVYGRLRSNVVQNVAREYQRTGHLWEHYNDESGRGEGSHPFTGWTSLVLLIMSEQYD